MNRILLFLLIPVVQGFAQNQAPRFNLNLNGGISWTAAKTFESTIIYGYGVSVPFYYHPVNLTTWTFCRCKHDRKPQAAWFAEAEVTYGLRSDFGLSIAAGAKRMRMDYNTMNLDDLNANFGNVISSYFTLSPNLSKGFFGNRLAVKGGPTFSFLMDSEVNNVVLIWYPPTDPPNIDQPDEFYFDNAGPLSKTLFGVNIGASYKIIPPIGIHLAAQYYFTPFFKEDGAYGKFYSNTRVDKVNIWTLQFGLSVAPFRFQNKHASTP
jgi:hypothetical protein